jgi:SAM-dependent methyltransferase
VSTWGQGEYPLMAERLEPAAVAAVEAAGVSAGERVLDVAAGTGNAALLAAVRGARVVGVDFEPALLAVAARRSKDRGLAVQWLPGDAGALPVAGESADVVLSVFGVMYASDHAAAARELARVAAPAARVVLACWAPGSVMPAMGQVVGAYLPPPPPGGPPSRWGDAEALAGLLGAAGLRLARTSVRRLELDFDDAGACARFLVRTAGHVMSEHARLSREGRWDDLLADMRAFVEDRAEFVGGRLALPLEYLLAEADKRSAGAAVHTGGLEAY